jgi:hypothetical protein
MSNKLIFLCLLVLSTQCSGFEWNDFIEGALEGLSVDNPEKCTKDCKESIDDFENAFESFSCDSMDNLKQSLYSFGDGFNALASGLDSCGITEMAEDIAEMASGFYDGMEEIELGVKIVCKGIDIYDDLKSAREAYEYGNAGEAGEEIGSLIKLLM